MKSVYISTAMSLLTLCLIDNTGSIQTTTNPVDVEVVQGYTAEFNCIVIGHTSNDNIQLLWLIQLNSYRDEVIVKDAESTYQLYNDPFGTAAGRGTYHIMYSYQQGAHHLTLKIMGVTRNDAGMFGCAYRYNTQGSTPNYFHSLVSLDIWYPPDPQYPTCDFTVTPIDNPNIEGSVSVQLSCLSEGGNPPVTLAWHYEASGIKLTEGGDAWITMTPADTGVILSCRATSDAIQGYRSCSITPLSADIVNPTPQPNIYPPNDGFPICMYEVSPASSSPDQFGVTLTCLSQGGNPLPVLSWRDDRDVLIQGGAQVRIIMHRTNSGRLYTCYATSPALPQPRSCSVIPILPAAPTTTTTTTTAEPTVPPDLQYPTCSCKILSDRDSSGGVFIQLNCTSKGGNPPAELTWYDHFDNVISITDVFQMYYNPLPGRFFKCKATSPAISAERFCTVIPELPPIPTLAPTTAPMVAPNNPSCFYNIFADTISRNVPVSILLVCTAQGGNPPATLIWHDDNNNPIGDSSENEIYTSTAVMPSQHYTFSCKVTSPAITGEQICTVSFQLLPPTIPPTTSIPTFPPDDGYPKCEFELLYITLFETASVKLKCISIGGNPEPDLTWYDSDGSRYSQNAELQVDISLDSHFQPPTFECRATSPAITGFRSCSVTPDIPLPTVAQTTPTTRTPSTTIPTTTTVLPTTSIPTFPPDDGYPKCEFELLDISLGTARVELKCISIGGNPEPELAWYRSDGSRIEQNSEIQVDITLDSHIQPPTYECRATSPAITGFRSCSVTPDIPLPTAAQTTQSRKTTATTSQPSTVETAATTSVMNTTTRPITTTTLSPTSKSANQTNPPGTTFYKSSSTKPQVITEDTYPIEPPARNDVMVVVSISVGVVILIIISVLIVGCILRGVVRRASTKPYAQSYLNPTSSSMSGHALNPFTGPIHQRINPIFQNHDDETPLSPPSPNAYCTTVEGLMNQHAYEYPTDANPYESTVNNNNEHIYSVTS